MDSTLTQILTALYQAHAQIDTLTRRVAELEAQQDAVLTQEEPCPPSS